MTVRANDLPTKWDGVPVTWGGWEDQPWTTLVFHVKQTPCGKCGSLAQPKLNKGLALRDSRVDALVRCFRLFAYRCPDCHHDQVYEMTPGDEDRLWDLDETDYGSEGSQVTQETLF